MATKDEAVYKHLKDTLFNNADSAIIGEALLLVWVLLWLAQEMR
jgi:hypothetical protein